MGGRDFSTHFFPCNVIGLYMLKVPKVGKMTGFCNYLAPGLRSMNITHSAQGRRKWGAMGARASPTLELGVQSIPNFKQKLVNNGKNKHKIT